MKPAPYITYAAWLAIVVLSMCACIEKWDAVNPKSQQPVAGNPCGPLWFPCLDMNGADNGACCSEGTTCGGGNGSVGCPADSCCNIRQAPDELRSGDSGVLMGASSVVVVQSKQKHLESK